MHDVSVRRVAVFGAGTLGGSLAAYLTNLGFSVTLIDKTLALAASGLERFRSTLYLPERMGEVRLYGFEDGIATLDDVDWVIEAIPERLELKRALYARIAPSLRADVIVTTCSSSLPLSELVHGLPAGVSTRFLGTCFALPFSQNRLVEVRAGTDGVLAKAFADFLANRVAKDPLHTRDEIAGPYARFGLWSLQLGIHVAEKLRLEVEDVETISALLTTGSGIFSTVDRIGLDVLCDVASNLRERLPKDRGVRYFDTPDLVVGLLARGWTGDKAGRGFLRHEGKDTLALNLATMAYRQPQESSIPSLRSFSTLDPLDRIRTGLSGRDEMGEFLREYLLTVLRYAEYLRESVGFTVLEIDRTMERGFGWRLGPFRLLDALGVGTHRYYDGESYLAREGYARIPLDEGILKLEDQAIIDRSEGFSIYDLGEGIQAVALHPGSLTPNRAEALRTYLAETKTDRLVLTSQEKDFPSLDIDFILSGAVSDPVTLDAYLADLQGIAENLGETACVTAIPGRCVGSSMAFAISCAGIVAVADAKLGFDEVKLGLIPTGGATAILRSRYGDSSKKASEIVVNLTEGLVTENADQARLAHYMRPEDEIEHRPDRLLATAKALVLSIPSKPRFPFVPTEPVLVGMIDRDLAARRGRGNLTEYDVAIGGRIRQVFARTSDYQECLDRERKEIVELCGKALTQARLRHMLELGKPIRN